MDGICLVHKDAYAWTFNQSSESVTKYGCEIIGGNQCQIFLVVKCGSDLDYPELLFLKFWVRWCERSCRHHSLIFEHEKVRHGLTDGASKSMVLCDFLALIKQTEPFLTVYVYAKFPCFIPDLIETFRSCENFLIGNTSRVRYFRIEEILIPAYTPSKDKSSLSSLH